MASRRGPDNSARIAISGTQSGNNWANIFHVQFTTSSSIAQADSDALLNTFQAQYKTSFAPRQVANVGYSLAKMVIYTPGGGELVSSVPMTGAGSNGGTQILDAAISAVISWGSTVYWRGGKPRTYCPGVPTADMNNVWQLTSTAQTNWTTAGSGFRTAVNAMTSGTITGTTLGFVSFSSGNVPRVPPVFYAVNTPKVHARVGTQRRRLGKWTN